MLKFETFDIDNEVHKNYALNFQSVLYIDNDDGTVRTSFINSTYILVCYKNKDQVFFKKFLNKNFSFSTATHQS